MAGGKEEDEGERKRMERVYFETGEERRKENIAK